MNRPQIVVTDVDGLDLPFQYHVNGDGTLQELPLQADAAKNGRGGIAKALGITVTVLVVLGLGTYFLLLHFMGAIDFKEPESNGSVIKVPYVMTNPSGRARSYQAHARLYCVVDNGDRQELLDADVPVAGSIPEGEREHSAVLVHPATDRVRQCPGHLRVVLDHQDVLPPSPA